MHEKRRPEVKNSDTRKENGITVNFVGKQNNPKWSYSCV